MTDYQAVLAANYFGTVWTMRGDNYADLVWEDESPKPKQAALDAAWPDVEYQRQYAQVEQARHAAYITDADPLFFKWQRETSTEQAWLDAVQTVKDSHPYPTAP